MKVAVAGGTGLTGRHVIEALSAAGHESVVLARSAGVDLVTGAGLDAALSGVDATIDVSNVTTVRRAAAVGFFERAGRQLLGAAARAGVRHHVALSIVGIDRVSTGYYEGKLRQEEIVRDGAVPWTVLRATQFHEFAEQILERLPGPVAVVPRLKVQPVAVREVAETLVAIAAGEPLKAAPDLAGPRVESLADMARRLVRTGTVRRRPVLPLWLPGPMAHGGLLPTGPGPRGTQTFEQWLQGRRR
ncbi:3-beta hydroxysteroid dehydrogenase [Actinoplanes sp. ATCC 53533]|uniref:SDR family oxidoreductase n=1 Tax=Actinoplanes sp. ATCC 53533 TaxID=1288362 RepID=UPI000F79C5D1|nr:NAD(P)H-binding protein [Actinoplanes sp. ATCC 53533]RSM51100.1 3-beta hydroxysteroid dehydrogenase [Actinoplanes sp. ATCC 53533]